MGEVPAVRYGIGGRREYYLRGVARVNEFVECRILG